MRVLLLNGPVLYKSAITHIPLELAYIGTLLEQTGFQVFGADLALEDDWRYSLRSLAETAPDIIITSLSRVLFDTTRNMPAAMACLVKLRERLKDAHICAIGEQATFRTELTMGYDFVDSVIRFSPELSARDLCVALRDNDDIEAVRGVFTQNNCCTRLGDSGWLTKIDNLDALGIPSRELFPVVRYLSKDTETILETSRGCLHRCVFCQRSRYHKYIVERSTPMVIADMKACSDLGFQSVFFCDLDFCRDARRALDMADAIGNSGLGMPWTCNMRADIVQSCQCRELLSRMKQAGCYRVFVGLESADAGILSSNKKGIDADDGLRLKSILDDIGIRLHASFLIGLPNDSIETMDRTVEYAKGLQSDMTSINALIPLPGTPYGDDPARFSLHIESGNPRWFEDPALVDRQICGNKHLSASQIEQWHRDAYRRLMLDD